MNPSCQVFRKTPTGERDVICLCSERGYADMVAKSVALIASEPNKKIYVTGYQVDWWTSSEAGGGWYDAYWRDEDGKLCSESRN